jgi:hypothetical protein
LGWSERENVRKTYENERFHEKYERRRLFHYTFAADSTKRQMNN